MVKFYSHICFQLKSFSTFRGHDFVVTFLVFCSNSIIFLILLFLLFIKKKYSLKWFLLYHKQEKNIQTMIKSGFVFKKKKQQFDYNFMTVFFFVLFPCTLFFHLEGLSTCIFYLMSSFCRMFSNNLFYRVRLSDTLLFLK